MSSMTDGLWHALLASLLALLLSLGVTGQYKRFPAFTCYVGASVAVLLGGFPHLKMGVWTVTEWALMVARYAAAGEAVLHLTRGMWWRKERRRVDLALVALPACLMLLWSAGSITVWLRHFQTAVAFSLLVALLVLRRIHSSPDARRHALVFTLLMANQAFDLWMWEWWPELGRETVLALNYAGAVACALLWVGLMVRPRIAHRAIA